MLECNGAAGYYGLALWTELTHSDTNYPCLEDNYNKIYTMSDPNADYLGQVCYKVEAGVIKKADINFNMGYPFSISGDKNSYDLLSVLTHELGHVMGLDHDTNNTSAVMYKSIGTGEIKRKFTALEKQYLYNLYH
ncbi:MAG: matrixin family metalloprotease [Lachnospiraceae bacterium]|nr:matrixin family metalloprotease [Lachnospiraceae bacterium]